MQTAVSKHQAKGLQKQQSTATPMAPSVAELQAKRVRNLGEKTGCYKVQNSAHYYDTLILLNTDYTI